MMVGEPDVIRGDIKFGPLHAGKSVVESLWAFPVVKGSVVGNCLDFALKSLSESKLFRWQKKYQEKDAAALIDRRGLWAFPVVKGSVVGNCLDFALKSLA